MVLHHLHHRQIVQFLLFLKEYIWGGLEGQAEIKEDTMRIKKEENY